MVYLCGIEDFDAKVEYEYGSPTSPKGIGIISPTYLSLNFGSLLLLEDCNILLFIVGRLVVYGY